MTPEPGKTVASPGYDGPERRAGAEHAALRTVILYVLADAFALLPEETMWAGFHLDEALSPLAGQRPDAVPAAVRHEMQTGEYALRLEQSETAEEINFPPSDALLRPVPAADWAAVLMNMVTSCYTLRPMAESSMHGQIVGMLRELGVGDPERPRPARYLPNDLRERLSSKNS